MEFAMQANMPPPPSFIRLIFSSREESLPPFLLTRRSAPDICPCGGIYMLNAPASHVLQLSGRAVAGKDISLSASVSSHSRLTRAHDELASPPNHHTLDLRQFSWAVRNSLTWANAHVSVALSNCGLFVPHWRRVYIVIGLFPFPVVDMVVKRV